MPALTAILYHDITERASPFEAALGVTTHPEVFASHLDWFQKNYDIIDIDTLIDGPLPKRPLLITFDDLYRSVLDTARECLAPRGIPSLFFVNPGLLGGDPVSLDGLLSWWAETHGMDALCARLGLGNFDHVGALLSGPLAGKNASERKEVMELLAGEGGPRPEDIAERSPVLEPEDLRVFKELGIAIGNHTSSHVHTRSLTAEECRTELGDAKARLEALSGQRVRAFSFPYGHQRDATNEVLASLRESGHEALFLVHARHNALRPAPDIWYRVSLHNEAVRQLYPSVALWPRLRSLKGRLKRSA